MPFIRRFLAREENRLIHITPQLPAVTSSMQATYLTGKPSGGHGIVANMWYDRAYAEHLSRSGAMVSGFLQSTRVNEPGRTAWLKVSAEM